MSNYTAKIQAQKDAVERMKVARSKAEATKEQLEKQRDQIEAEIRGYGVEPSDMEAKIAELDTSIRENIAKVDEMIPTRFRGAR